MSECQPHRWALTALWMFNDLEHRTRVDRGVWHYPPGMNLDLVVENGTIAAMDDERLVLPAGAAGWCCRGGQWSGGGGRRARGGAPRRGSGIELMTTIYDSL